MVKLSVVQQTAMDRFKEVKRLTGRSDWFTPYQVASSFGTCDALVRANLLERCPNGRLYRLKVECKCNPFHGAHHATCKAGARSC